MMCRRTRTHLTQGALGAAKSLAKHIRGQDLQTLPLHSNCYQIFQLFSTKLFLFALFPLHLHIKRTIETSRKQRRRRRWRDERRGGRERLRQQRDPGSEAPNACFNGNNKLLSQAIKSAFDTYLSAEVHCAI